MTRPLLSFLLVIFLNTAFSQTDDSASTNKSPEEVIAQLYNLVTFEPGTLPYWNNVRNLFHPDAKIVLRTSLEESTIFDLEGFIKDFDDFAKTEKINEYGFEEKILKKKKMIFGDIAHFLVLYQAHFPGTDYPPQQGVDSFQLIKIEDGWKIISIVNEIVTPDRPAPKELQ